MIKGSLFALIGIFVILTSAYTTGKILSFKEIGEDDSYTKSLLTAGKQLPTLWELSFSL